MTLRSPVSLLLAAVAVCAAAAQAQIAPGNVAVLRIGTGAAALTNAATPVFLDEYTPAGGFVQSIALPTAASGANLAYGNSGTATSEGILTQSADGNFLVAAGYAAVPGTTGIASTTSASVPRVIARIGLDGSVDTSTSINNLFSANNVRGATTDDGSRFWAVGGNSGVVFAPLGATTGTSLNSTAPTNIRVAGIFAGQLYVTSGSGSNRGVNALGVGLPTTSGQTGALLPGFPTSTAPSPYDFFFADADTVYVADDRTNGSGGIEKWVQSAGVWSLAYLLSPGATVGCRGLSGSVVGGVTTLFATTTGNALVSVVDTGAGPGTFTTLAAAPTNTAFRGVRFVRRAPVVAYSGAGSPTTFGVPSIAPANGLPLVGNTAFTVAAGNLVPNGFGFGLLTLGALGSGFPVAGAPATVLIYVSPLATPLLLADGLGAASTPLGIPAASAFVGLPIAAQILAYDPALADPVPVGTSVGMALVVGI